MKPEELIGVWRFRRDIDDRRAAAQLRAHGTAEFSPQPDGRIRWFESGRLSWGGGASAFTRTLYLVPPDRATRGGSWMVTFEDGRRFHPWVEGDVRHLCGRDTYRGDIDAGRNCSAWSLVWTVSGPAKDYTMTTTYRAV